jgi:aminoglycoside phosphotransferase (APT) family kinase protein
VSIADEPTTVNDPPELRTVLAHLRRQFDVPELRLDRPPQRLSGGFWAEMWALTTESGMKTDLPRRVVLRLAPDANHAAWETVFQASVAEQGYPTPTVRASDFTLSGGNRAWCVMDHAEGSSLLGDLSGVGALAALPRLVRKLPDTLARAAANLHRLDPEPVENALGRTTNRTIGIDGLLDYYQARAHELDDVPLQRALQRLVASRPDSTLRVVCHGDLHPFNILTSSDGQITVLDWTVGQIAHPAYDLAFTHLLLANPPLDAPKPLRPIINAAARRIAARFLTTYRTIGPHPVDDATLDWYRRLQGCRILFDLADWRAAGELEAHRGHPWFALESSVLRLFAE